MVARVLPGLCNFPVPIVCPSEEGKSQFKEIRFHLCDLSFRKNSAAGRRKKCPKEANSPLWVLLAGKENSAGGPAKASWRGGAYHRPWRRKDNK